MKSPLLTQAAAEFWAMEGLHLSAMLEVAEHFDISQGLTTLAAMNANTTETEEEDPYEIRDGVAVIPVHGTILKSVPEMWKVCGCTACGCEELKAAVNMALNDSNVKKILLHIESPGGTVSGVQEAGDVIFDARQVKPVHAYCSDLCASAAYWLGCQAETMAANLTAHVGSIGVYTVYVDSSRAYEDRGYKVHLIASGPHKGAGEAGVPISKDQLEAIQENVDDLATLFKVAISRGRGVTLDTVAGFATGRTWISPKALETGLIDFVENEDQVISRIAAM